MKIYGNSFFRLKGKLIQSYNAGILIKFKKKILYVPNYVIKSMKIRKSRESEFEIESWFLKRFKLIPEMI